MLVIDSYRCMYRSQTGAPAPPSGADPYSLFPAFNKNDFPPHAASGFWGAASPIEEAIPPTTTTSVSVGTFAELQTAYNLGARHITLTASIEGSDGSELTLTGDATDIRITVPSPYRLAYINFGNIGGGPDYPSTITRLKFDGTGQLHYLRFNPRSGSSDLIFDGINMTGPAFASPEGNRYAVLIDTWYHVGTPINRVAFTSVKAACGAWFYGGHIQNLTVVNCSIITGLKAGNQEAWGFRHYPVQNAVFWGNDIRTATVRTQDVYHRIRCHVNYNFPTDGLVWIANNTFVDRVESRIFEVNSGMGDSGLDNGNHAAVWFTNNTVIATGSGGLSLRIGDSDNSLVTDNTFQSDTFTSTSNFTFSSTTESSAGLNPVTTGNTFTSLPGSDPAWGGAGDPTGLTWDF